ncbi:MAG TPA: exosortase/archaeosortase family protein [Terriglobales bacterium]|jgi:exosortase|nr:exosortase/archaeosortase family protein [Terriglobales bacterium]
MITTRRNQNVAFAFLCVASIVLWWRPLVGTLRLALGNDAYTHIILIVPLSAVLIILDAKTRRIDGRPGYGLGLVLIVAAALIRGYARWGMVAGQEDIRLTLAMFALVAWLMGSVVLCFGERTFRQFLFPLCFLFLIVPIPDFVLKWIVEFLQQQSAVAARLMFRAAGVPVTQDGIMLSIPGLDIEVATECSSIRSSLMLMVTTLVFAQLFLRSWWRKVMLVAMAIPLSVAKNGLRIFTIGELGTRVDPGFLNGRFHRNGGIVFFAISVLGVAVLLWILRWTELRGPASTLHAVAE